MSAGFRSPFFFGLGGGFAPSPTPLYTAWTLGPLWTNAVICAKLGSYGLQRVGDGVTGGSIVSTAPLTVAAGERLFASVYVKAGIGADGVIGFGFAFYSSTGALLSSEFVETSTLPVDWLQLGRTITVPMFGVLAIPIIRSVGHLNGSWCVDAALVTRSGGNWNLSLLRHFHSDYVSAR